MSQEVDEKWRISGTLMYSVVDGEFYQWDKRIPLAREAITKASQNIGNNAIDPFGLTIRFRMSC